MNMNQVSPTGDYARGKDGHRKPDMDGARGASATRLLRKSALAMCCILLPLLAAGQEKKVRTWERFDSILQEGVRFITPWNDYIYLPFADEDTGLTGFVRAGGSLGVRVPPVYQDLYNNQEFLLVAVKKDGKWGAVDLGDRWWSEEYHAPDPIVPCIYDEVWLIDDTYARVIKDGRSRVIDVGSGLLTRREFFSPAEQAKRRQKEAEGGAASGRSR